MRTPPHTKRVATCADDLDEKSMLALLTVVAHTRRAAAPWANGLVNTTFVAFNPKTPRSRWFGILDHQPARFDCYTGAHADDPDDAFSLSARLQPLSKAPRAHTLACRLRGVIQATQIHHQESVTAEWIATFERGDDPFERGDDPTVTATLTAKMSRFADFVSGQVHTRWHSGKSSGFVFVFESDSLQRAGDPGARCTQLTLRTEQVMVAKARRKSSQAPRLILPQDLPVTCDTATGETSTSS